MPLTSLCFLVLFSVACLGALGMPMIGIAGYMSHYHVFPEIQWWGEPLSQSGIRFSFLLAACTAFGFLASYRRSVIRGPIMTGQEWLILVFVGLTWLSTLVGLPLAPATGTEDPPQVKMTKIAIFVLIMTHVVTTVRNVRVVLWTIALGVGWLGVQAYFAGPSMFSSQGRLNSIGGPDFREANGLGAYLAATIFLTSALFLRTKWKGKMLCGAVIIFAANTIVLTSSRGAAVGLGVGMIFALVTAPAKRRIVTFVAMLAIAAAVFALADEKFLSRSQTVTATGAERDRSSQTRIDIWRGAMKMFKEYPLGVGAGKFQPVSGRFIPDHPNSDTHNTFLRCCCELGIQGAFVFVLLIGNALWMLRNAYKRGQRLSGPDQADVAWFSIALAGALVTFLACGITASFVYNEALWWFLCLPVCLCRAINAAEAASGIPLKEIPRAS